MTRRAFLRIAGSSAVIAAAGAGSWLSTRSPTRALQPWQQAGKRVGSDPRMHALSYAVLAPTPHNRQPWLVDLARPGRATLRCDPERLLPQTDPFSRQIVIGLGCFVELAVIAAGQTGHRVAVTPFPDGVPGDSMDDRPVAHLDFVPDRAIAPDPLFAHILQRRSAKVPFDPARPLGPQTLDALQSAVVHGSRVETTAVPERVDRLRDLTWRAFKTELETPRAHLESVRLMRIGRAEIEQDPDGIDLGGPLLDSLHALGQLDRATLSDPNSAAHKSTVDRFEPVMTTAMAYAWLSTPGNTRPEQLTAGRDYVRLNLKATALGVGMHPVSQALQEYREMTDALETVHRELQIDAPARVQMLARLGYGSEVGPSPRWPLASKLVAT